MKRVGLIMVLFLFEAHVHAMLPVVDAGAILQMGSQLKQLKEQYDLMKNAHDTAKSQLSNGLSQLDQLKDLTGANKGSYGFGNLQNSIDELTQRQGSNTWEEALNNLAGGNADRYSQLATAYERMHPTLSDEEYKRGASDTRLALYKQNKAVNKAVTVQTTEAFNQVNKHLQRVHDLSKEIEGKTNKNTKSAIDLNTRLLVETAYIQIGMLKLQALINQQAVQVTANEIAEDSEAARFNQLPKG